MKLSETVNILGTEYKIIQVKVSENELLKNKQWSGLCNELTKEILIGDTSEEEFFGVMNEEEQELMTKQIARHEITHAFFSESGLSASSLQYSAGWSNNEEMVDWMALQFPKMMKAFEEVGCL